MIKLISITALLGITVASQNLQALSWTVECVKQGPARGFDARSLRPGKVAKPSRILDPAAGNPGNTVGYPIGVRSIPNQAVVAEQSDISGAMNFISLGFGGQIILRSTEWVANGPGSDFTLFETTWGNPVCRPTNSEQALVEISEDGVNWIAPGVTPGTVGAASNGLGGIYNTCYNGSFDITPLSRVQYVRITDRTNPDWKVQGDGVDGYDVDGIVANYPLPPTPNCSYTPSAPCGYEQGVASQYVGQAGNFPGRGIASVRKNFANANLNEEGFPVEAFTNPGVRDSGSGSGSYNFWSIGFGGWACFPLEYTLIDGPGYDIYVFETTWNNKPCPNYNEKVRVMVSMDGANWSAPITICKDAIGIPGTSPAIDLAAYGPEFSMVNFIRFEDASSPSDFGAGADSYDIDNIVFAQIRPICPGEPNPYFSCENSINVRRSFPVGASTYMEGGVPEEMFALELVGSNIVDDKLIFKATIAEDGGYSYTVRSSTGQEVMKGEFAGGLFETPVAEISTSSLTNGVYFLTLTSASGRETVKFVKN